MKKKTSTAITTVIRSPEVVPKASKSDIIKAAVERARIRHLEEVAKYQTRRKESFAKLKKAALDECGGARGIRDMECELDINSYCERAQLHITLKSSKVKTLYKGYEAIQRPGSFDPSAVKSAILEAMDGTEDRANLILSTPENVAKIDALLNMVFQPATKTIEA